MDLIGFLIVLVVLGIVFYLLSYLIDSVPMFEPFRAVAKAVLILIAVLFLLGALFGQVNIPSIRLR